jgi:hypothetical protein
MFLQGWHCNSTTLTHPSLPPLQLQRFVELLRLGDSALHDALAFAQETLAPLVQVMVVVGGGG